MSESDWPYWLPLLVSWLASMLSAYFLGRADECMWRVRKSEREARNR